IWRASKSARFFLIFLEIFRAFFSICDIVYIKFLIDYALSQSFSFPVLLFALCIYFAMVFLSKAVMGLLVPLFTNALEGKVMSCSNAALYEKILRIGMADYNNTEFYNKLSLAMRESGIRYFQLVMQVISFLQSAIVGLTVITIYGDPVILLACVLFTLNYMIYSFRTNKKNYNFTKQEEPYERLVDYLDHVFYRREYAEELRSNEGIKTMLLAKYDRETEEDLGRTNKYLHIFAIRSNLMLCLDNLILWVAAIYVSAKVLKLEISAGEFLVMINMVSSISGQLIQIFKGLPDIVESARYVGDIRDIFDYPEDFRTEGKIVCGDFWHLKFNHVVFRYASSVFAIRDMSFEIDKNEIIALVGKNGSGKSTLVDLLMGLIRPQGGEILLNGRAYQEYDIRSIRKLFGVVFQDFQMYEVSVAENILMREMKSEEDRILVEEALRFVGLYERVLAMEKGIHTVISCGGGSFGEGEDSLKETVDFSGGERQKLSIARAYATKAPLLVFDEPTGNLDIYATQAFYNAMFGMREQGRTILFTTHKLYYASRADKIFYLEDGTVTESGSHGELLKRGGGYAALYAMQKEELFAQEVFEDQGVIGGGRG
nr:ABC transporter ATP-binding protein/permease [Lachnospiraceae bacterium]